MNELRLQQILELPEINISETVSLLFTLKLSKLFAKQVDKIRIFVDGKNQVIEISESNNVEEFNWPS